MPSSRINGVKVARSTSSAAIALTRMFSSILHLIRETTVNCRFFLRQTGQFGMAVLNHLSCRVLAKPVAWPYKTIYIDPREIEGKFRRSPDAAKWPLGAVVDGDWDQDVRSFEDTKQQGVLERYKEGLPWAETVLFRLRYRRLLRSGGSVKGCADVGLLARRYEAHMDGVFKSIEQNGFKKARIFSRKIQPIYVHIGRHGQIIAYNGSHRLAIAMALDLNEIPVRVWARHKLWEENRKKMAFMNKPSRIGVAAACHPDLRVNPGRIATRIGGWMAKGRVLVIMLNELYDV